MEEKINLENKKKKELEEEMKKLNIIENEILGRIYANNEMQRKLIENFEKKKRKKNKCLERLLKMVCYSEEQIF